MFAEMLSLNIPSFILRILIAIETKYKKIKKRRNLRRITVPRVHFEIIVWATGGSTRVIQWPILSRDLTSCFFELREKQPTDMSKSQEHRSIKLTAFVGNLRCCILMFFEKQMKILFYIDDRCAQNKRVHNLNLLRKLLLWYCNYRKRVRTVPAPLRMLFFNKFK